MIDDWIEVKPYLPAGVKRIIGRGATFWIGELNEATVLKYPNEIGLLDPDEARNNLIVERKLFEEIGEHDHIIKSRGLREDGFLVLERATNGNIFDYMANHPHLPEISRLRWCIETCKALVHCHKHHVLHCDIRHRNILLDDKLRVKLADFQGRLITTGGETVYDGGSQEQAQYYCPRNNMNNADIKTDLFGFGSTIFFLMVGHDPFPDITGQNEGDDEEVERRFRSGEFPEEIRVCTQVVEKCWKLSYNSAEEVLQDLEALMMSSVQI
ncbi:putative serine/threonine-protein kinase Sps1 [Colletotrichum tanaceti]|uniref:EKC/KEOPS complex subunit BUD32 n=1 Tax=Colletotrichum tanaceti TaxID=1306861 RepID=A0A4U6X0W6_9PEZI|nr:putative serine/threonine-protein kinase Sps1 [Colletotrichum tanaceti]TKW48785.1 putative serine/threonine-protein kinase Sps1 [Colletotrichum tanaceti]